MFPSLSRGRDHCKKDEAWGKRSYRQAWKEIPLDEVVLFCVVLCEAGESGGLYRSLGFPSWDILHEMGRPSKRTHMLEPPGLQNKSPGPADRLCFSLPPLHLFGEVEWVDVFLKNLSRRMLGVGGARL